MRKVGGEWCVSDARARSPACVDFLWLPGRYMWEGHCDISDLLLQYTLLTCQQDVRMRWAAIFTSGPHGGAAGEIIK